MSDFINTIDLLGDEIVLGNILNGNIAELKDNVVTCIKKHAFRDCSTLTLVDCPNTTIVEERAFSNCQNLTNVGLYNVTSIHNSSFYGCINLKTLDFPNVTSITDTFQSCTNLTSFILRSNTLCTLSSSSYLFNGSKIASGQGYVYVPRALKDQYVSDSKWSTLGESKFRALEDYTVDGTTTGELDETKI